MINIPMLEDGPDMELLEEVVKDPAVKGMFLCAEVFQSGRKNLF